MAETAIEMLTSYTDRSINTNSEKLAKHSMSHSMILIHRPSFSLKLNVTNICRDRKTRVVCCCPFSGSNSKKPEQISGLRENWRYTDTTPENSKVHLSEPSSENGAHLFDVQPDMEAGIRFVFNFIASLLPFRLFSWITEGWKEVKAPDRQRLPPCPPKLPVIGHVHHIIGSLPHHYPLRNLARIYGPLMHLKFGEVTAIIVSSSEAAKTVLKTHDPACADRPKSVATEIMWYNYSDIIFSPYGDYWKQMRKICILELLSAKNVRSFEYIRKDEALLLIESIRSTSGAPVDLTEKISLFMNSMTCRAAFGNASMDRVAAIKLIKKAFSLAGHFDLADLFPSFKLFNFITLNKYKLLKLRSKLDKIFDDVIVEHVKNLDSTKMGYGELGTEDLVDVLLRLKASGEAEFPITNDSIKSVISVSFSSHSHIRKFLESPFTLLSNKYSEMCRICLLEAQKLHLQQWTGPWRN